MALYEVVCRCGHVGNGKYVLKSFAVCGKDAKDAARRAREIPRVKHHNKHAIESVKQIDEYRFCEIQYANEMDPYFACRNKREQWAVCDLNVFVDDAMVELEVKRSNDSRSKKTLYSGKTKIKNPRKFIRFQSDDYGYAA